MVVKNEAFLTNLKSVLLAGSLLLAGCAKDTRPYDPLARSTYRDQLFAECMKLLPAGPQSTKYNDWDDVVDSCSTSSLYRANERYKSNP